MLLDNKSHGRVIDELRVSLDANSKMAVLTALFSVFGYSALSRVTVDQFYGIEFEEFPARIAEVAMWMTDHLANNELNEAFRLNYARIPLKDTAHIRHGDALEVDWADVIAPARCSYIMGNPPFVGQSHQTPLQREQMARVIDAPSKRAGSLDYVAAWFLKAGAFVNGEQRGHPQPLQQGLEGSSSAPSSSPLHAFVEGPGVAPLLPGQPPHPHRLRIHKLDHAG